MYYTNVPNNNNEDRFFIVPFLLGGLGGAAIASAARPRPVFVNPQPYYPSYYPYGYNYYGGYNYYPPYYR